MRQNGRKLFQQFSWNAQAVETARLQLSGLLHRAEAAVLMRSENFGRERFGLNPRLQPKIRVIRGVRGKDLRRMTRVYSTIYKYRGWLLVGLVIFFVGAVRIRMREMPLERDEGEYAYAGQLILQGIPPY